MSTPKKQQVAAVERALVQALGQVVEVDDGKHVRLERQWDGAAWQYRFAPIAAERAPFVLPELDPHGLVALTSATAVLTIEALDWVALIDLFEGYGWTPSGSLPPSTHPDPLVWKGDYLPPMGQRVVKADAAAMARAVALALPDIPRGEARVRPARSEVRNAIEWFAGERRQCLISFVEFCRKPGEFEVQAVANARSN